MKNPTIFQLIPLEHLQRGRYQPRTLFREEGLRELSESILTQGLIEPLVVRQQAPCTYEIIAGERRWRAAMMAGLTEIPCLIGDYTDAQAATVSLIENIQREALSLLEEAAGYQRLLTEFQFTQQEVAALVGKSRSHIANLLRLLTLSPAVQAHLHQGALTLGHARMLVGLSTEDQGRLANRVIHQQWSVRKLENEIRAIKQPLELPSADRERLEIHLAEQMGTPVHIMGDEQQGGWLKIKFYDNDTLSGLLDRMGLRYDEGDY